MDKTVTQKSKQTDSTHNFFCFFS